MRVSVCALTILLLLAPVGLAQSGSSGTGTCADEDDARERDQCEGAASSCHDQPPEVRCQRSDGNQTPGGHDDDDGNETAGERGDDSRGERAGWCRDNNRTAQERQRCKEAFEQVRDERRRDWIDFRVDAANATLLDYTVADLLVLESIRLDLHGNLSFDRHGSTLRVRSGDGELRLHDEPNGLMRFKGADGNVTLELPSAAAIERGPHGARISYLDGRDGHLVGDNLTWTADRVVVLQGFFAFHIPPRGAAAERAERAEDVEHVDPEVQERKQEAIERRTLGAEITLKPRGVSALAADQESVKILAYDDVDVEVDLPDDEASSDAPVRIVVSAELDEGRTIVVNVDEKLLASTDAENLVLRYFDLYDQVDGSIVETEVVFRAATSLQDVLDPADDGGQPEFWVVKDVNGVQVLVSVPHWSAHAITVASIATTLHAPSVVVGIVAGVAVSALAGTLLLWPRRRDDEL